jgi:poly(hydroxyalkanoate) depolymerase family esterase
MFSKFHRSILAGLLARGENWLKLAAGRSSSPARRRSDTANVAKSAPDIRGQFLLASYTNRSGTRAYKAYIPARGRGQSRPLVVMLHGCKQNPDDFAAGTRMNELADEMEFIVAYPEQASAANVSRCWNWFRAADQQRDGGEPSLIAGITREVIARYDVDPRRVYVAGLSAGGAMAAIMGHTYPDLYAAIGIHSGLAYASASDIPSALAAMRGRRFSDRRVSESTFHVIPTIVFHGDLDTTVHSRNGEQVIAQATPAGDDLAVRAFAPQTVEKGEERGRRYTRTSRADSSGKPALEHWLVHGAGHAWSGGSVNGSYTDPRGPDATRAMLRFFLSARRVKHVAVAASPHSMMKVCGAGRS